MIARQHFDQRLTLAVSGMGVLVTVNTEIMGLKVLPVWQIYSSSRDLEGWS